MSEPDAPSPHPSSREGPASLAVLDASPNAIVGVDAEGRIRYVNPQAERDFGYARAELLGQPIEQLVPHPIASRHEAHRRAFLDHPVARPMGIGLDLAGRRKDGSEFPVEISLASVGGPDGPVVFATVVDITARKAAERALADSERRLRDVLEAAPNAIVAVGADGRITYANPAATGAFGYEREELLGEPIERLLPERVKDRHVTHRASFLQAPGARPMGTGRDLSGRRKDGREFPVEISLSPVDVGGDLQVFATIVDITARKSAEAQLLQAQKLESIGRLAGGIAHDFNNMLFAIHGFTELLEMELTESGGADVERSLDRVASIQDAADRATKLTSQLLAFSRQQVVEPRVVSVREAVSSMEPMLRSLINADIDLVTRLDPATGLTRMDPSQLDQVLVNLAVNARDAMPDGGRLTIETGNAVFDEPYAMEHFDVAAGSYVVLAVADTGIGMDVETLQHVFEPFFTTKERGKGTGLGLATIYGIVRQAAGHIWLYSEPGRGSTFKLYLPRIDAPVEESTPAVAPAPVGRGRILVVEDDAAVRAVTVQMLERAGYQVTAVGDGREAIDAVERSPERVAVVVSDVVMPQLSGIELADWLWGHDASIGVVLLSGYTSDAVDVDRARDRGAVFLSKPASFRAMVDAIEQVANRGHGQEPPANGSGRGDAGTEAR
jgi:PAS domain S-box-containing protein